MITVSLAEKTNTYFKTGLFKSISVSGSSILTGPFYLASDEDLKKIKGNENQKIISFAIDHFEKYQLDRNILGESQNDILSFSKNNRKIFSHYFNQFVRMQDFFENKINYPQFFDIESKDQLLVRELSSKHCTDIAIQLIKMKPKENLIFYMSNVLYGMGGYFILVLQIILSLICLITLVDKDKNRKFSLIILFFITLNFSNILGTALYQPVYDRFSFPTFQMIYFSITLIFLCFLSKKKVYPN